MTIISVGAESFCVDGHTYTHDDANILFFREFYECT
jgi:hypothetical protein